MIVGLGDGFVTVGKKEGRMVGLHSNRTIRRR